MEQVEWREALADAKLKEDSERLEEMASEITSILHLARRYLCGRLARRASAGCDDAGAQDALHAEAR